jgi:hypothetical protein
MQLALALPEAWPVKVFDNGRRCAIVPGHAGTPDLVIDIDPLVPTPDDPRAWIDFSVARDLPGNARPKLVHSVDSSTTLGWPMQILHVVLLEVHKDKDGEQEKEILAETRLAAFYKFNEYAGHAMVRGTHVERWEAHRGQLLEILQTGRPDYRSPNVIAAISELFR